jgi:hypothetical protein
MPPLTLENASALVAGGGITSKEEKMRPQTAPAQPETVKVKVLRSFYHQGKAFPVDTEVDVPRLFARELEASKKAEILKAPPPAPAKTEAKTEAKTDVRPDSKADGGKGGRLV